MGCTTFNSIAVTESPGIINFVSGATISTAGDVTYTAAQLLGGLILRNPNGAARADVLPTAASIIAAMAAALGVAPTTGMCFVFHLRNTAGAAETITVTTNTGLTLSGTMTVAQNNSKQFLIAVTGPTTCTVFSIGTAVF